jgi:hypothetical protein
MKTKRRKKKSAISAAAAVLGRIGGLTAAGAGVRSLYAKMTPEQRSEKARHASIARWSRKPKRKPR